MSVRGVIAVSAVWICGLASAEADEPQRCGGEKVTISYRDLHSTTIAGTPGRDVIQGGPKDEVITGGGGPDVICGGDGADTIGGGPGHDELRGEGDEDSFGEAGAGADPTGDEIFGGPGQDTASYVRSPVGVRVNMKSGNVRTDASGRRGGIDDVEELVGSRFGDILLGNAFAGRIDALEGDDTVDPGDAYRMLARGGPGLDVIAFATSKEPVTAALNALAFIGKGKDRSKIQLDDFEAIVGSDRSDRLAGTDDDDIIVGGAGNDELVGGDGDDLIKGEQGSDQIRPGNGDDTVDGGPNLPVTSKKAYGDLVSYRDVTYSDPDPSDFDEGLSIVLGVDRFGTPPHAQGPSNADNTGYGKLGFDTLIGIESAQGIRSRDPRDRALNDIEGDDGPNVLVGANRQDGIYGEGGNDFIFGNAGNDVLDGGAGDDLIDAGPNGGAVDGGPGRDTCEHADKDISKNCEAGSSGDNDGRRGLFAIVAAGEPYTARS